MFIFCFFHQPSFGSNQIVTPPGNRHPVALLTGVSDVHEQINWAGEDIRGSGVGSDIDVDGKRNVFDGKRNVYSLKRDYSPVHTSTLSRTS